MILAVLLSVFVGYDDNIGKLFVLSRAIVFAPFFLADYYADPQCIDRFLCERRKYTVIIGVTGCIAVFLLYYINTE